MKSYCRCDNNWSEFACKSSDYDDVHFCNQNYTQISACCTKITRKSRPAVPLLDFLHCLLDGVTPHSHQIAFRFLIAR